MTMKKTLEYVAILLFIFAPMRLSSLAVRSGAPAVLRCDAMDRPLGDDNRTPLFSWQLQDTRTGAHQSAYRIRVATDPQRLSSGHADVWDSGYQASDRSVDVAYTGPALRPETRYYWRVQAWDQDGKAYLLSKVTWWETGLMGQAGWVGRWIGYESLEQRSIREAEAAWMTNPEIPGAHPEGPSNHCFRLVFSVPEKLKAGTLYVTGGRTQPRRGSTVWPC